jgi:hypothetical protein
MVRVVAYLNIRLLLEKVSVTYVCKCVLVNGLINILLAVGVLILLFLMQSVR